MCAAAFAEKGQTILRIPSANMEPTIKVGATIKVHRDHYLSHPPARGDIVMFRLPDDPRSSDVDESRQEYISRIIAISGDTIEISKMTVKLNEEPLQERYVQWTRGGWSDFPRTTVRPPSVFVLGDNRDASRDSRFYADTFVRYQNLVGKVTIE